MAALTAASLVATGVGTAVSAASTLAGGAYAKTAGQAARGAADFEARQLEQNAQTERAVAQRAALERRRVTRLAQSSLIARAAAGGTGSDDPGVIKLAGDIAERGEYQALMEMFQGENTARGLEAKAAGARYSGRIAEIEGEARSRGATLKALGTFAGGAGSMLATYGGVGPPLRKKLGYGW